MFLKYFHRIIYVPRASSELLKSKPKASCVDFTSLLPSFSLVLLVFLNMMLFYKLWMLEYSAQSLTTWQSLRLQERYTGTDSHSTCSCHLTAIQFFFYCNSSWLKGFRGTWRYKNLIPKELGGNRVLLQLLAPKAVYTVAHMHSHPLSDIQTKLYPYGHSRDRKTLSF